MVCASFAEILSIGSVLPFLSVLIAPDSPKWAAFIDPLKHLFNLNSSRDILAVITIAFCACAIGAGLIRLLLLRKSLFLSAAIGSDIGFDMYNRTLHQPYENHLNRNSSETIDGISIKSTAIANGVVMPILYIISSAIMVSVIFISLLYISPLPTLLALMIFGAIYLSVIAFTKNQLLKNSKDIAIESVNVIRSLQEGLGGIRDVLLDGTQKTFGDIYKKSDFILRRAYASSSFISVSPRFAVEAIGILLIALLAFYTSTQPNGIQNAIPIIGAAVLAAQRILPLMQQSYSAWSNLRQNQYSLIDTLEFLDQKIPDYFDPHIKMNLQFENSIALDNLSFMYFGETKFALQNISLTINKGARIGIVGETGSGKSTLLDILMGLLRPTSGGILVDGIALNEESLRSWQNRIAHVPQNIFLSDGTIEENIAFGSPTEDIDHKLSQMAIEQAQLSDFIDSLPNGLSTLVGEGGLKLSGGQRQRIGIARAIYKKADIIIFDEATSALDAETENAVIKSINGLSKDLTIIMVAHRLSTLKDCSRIIKLDKLGNTTETNYQSLISI
jgi:ATP-binding cassette subfamily B protein